MNKAKTLILIISLLFSGVLTYSQEMVFGKAEFIHGSGKDKVADLHLDSDDNLYMAGSFEHERNIGIFSNNRRNCI